MEKRRRFRFSRHSRWRKGLDRVAAAKSARILRQTNPGSERTQIPINLTRILAGRTDDVALRANDILFVPNNTSKSATLRAIEAAIQVGTGVVIWGREEAYHPNAACLRTRTWSKSNDFRAQPYPER